MCYDLAMDRQIGTADDGAPVVVDDGRPLAPVLRALFASASEAANRGVDKLGRTRAGNIGLWRGEEQLGYLDALTGEANWLEDDRG